VSSRNKIRVRVLAREPKPASHDPARPSIPLTEAARNDCVFSMRPGRLVVFDWYSQKLFYHVAGLLQKYGLFNNGCHFRLYLTLSLL
jgi:hypothetical protein